MTKLKAHISYSPWLNLYDATLLGGEFDNCYGQGPTPEQAMISLKLVVRVRRKSRDTYANAKVQTTCRPAT